MTAPSTRTCARPTRTSACIRHGGWRSSSPRDACARSCGRFGLKGRRRPVRRARPRADLCHSRPGQLRRNRRPPSGRPSRRPRCRLVDRRRLRAPRSGHRRRPAARRWRPRPGRPWRTRRSTRSTTCGRARRSTRRWWCASPGSCWRPTSTPLAAELARRSGIDDVTTIPVGYPVRIPLELLLPEYLPAGNPRRQAWEKEREELAAIRRAIRAANLDGIHVILDAGHGGGDTGATVGGVVGEHLRLRRGQPFAARLAARNPGHGVDDGARRHPGRHTARAGRAPPEPPAAAARARPPTTCRMPPPACTCAGCSPTRCWSGCRRRR